MDNEKNIQNIESTEKEKIVTTNIFAVVEDKKETIELLFVFDNLNVTFPFVIDKEELILLFDYCELFECNAGLSQDVYDIMFEVAKKNNIGIIASNMKDFSYIIEEQLDKLYAIWKQNKGIENESNK